MKSIPLKVHPTAKEISTVIMLKEAINNIPANDQGQPIGFTFQDIEIRLKINELLKNLPADAVSLELEDADWYYVRDKVVPNMRFTMLDSFIVEFGKSFK